MERDIRETELYREAEALYKAVRKPGAGQISEAAEVSASPDGAHAVFSGTLVDKLEGSLPTRICVTELGTRETRVLTFGPSTDRSPRYSPDGRRIAFLSDRHTDGDFQLYLLDPASGAARSTPPVEAWVEYLQWSPDGQHVLLGVAGHGADVAGAKAAVTSKLDSGKVPSWMPGVEAGDETHRRHRAWAYEVATNSVRQITRPAA